MKKSPDTSLPPCDLLHEIYATRMVTKADGSSIQVRDFISPSFAEALYRTVLARRPALVIEVGMAHGLSALSILSALRDAGGGRLISIDPAQSTDYAGIGILNVRRAGLDAFHELIEASSFQVLPQLLGAKTQLDFAYIDGWHTFDYALLDFFYVDKMLRQGGCVAFNDCGWQSVHRVISFVQTHRKYREIDVGLPPDYRGGSLLSTLVHIFQRRSRSNRYFAKLEPWEPNWNFYRRF